MLTPSALRRLGPDGLARLIRRRPDVLEPVPPKSLAELVARLTHPVHLRAALGRLDLPTLQVAEALAALGEDASRARLDRLLAIGPDDPRAADVSRAVDSLRERCLVVDGCRLVPQARALWTAPLGLDEDTATLASSTKVDDLRAILGNLGVPRAAGRKAELVDRLVRGLSDADTVRGLVASGPPGLADQLMDVAHGRRRLSYYRWFYPRQGDHVRSSGDPLEWAMARFLLVQQDWNRILKMPAEVALALRGPGWSPPFTPTFPEVAWALQDPAAVADASVAAAGQALRSLTAVLTAAGEHPIPLLKSGRVGVRELRRLAAVADCGTGPVRLTLTLAHQLDLLDLTGEGLVPTLAWDAWQREPAARRLADLVRRWLVLGMSPMIEPDAAWAPQLDRRAEALRRAVLDLLARHPGAAADSAEELASAVRWQLPMLLGDGVLDGPAEVDDEDDGGPDAAAGDGAGLVAVRAVLDEAAWLGLTGAGALSPVGVAAQSGGDVAAQVEDALGAVRGSARLQADLTAVVLGEPAPELAAALDLMADRESRSAATTWRFSPASIRRAMDGGASERELLDALAALAEGGVPQPLGYLVRDVARRHGVLRGGQVGCYLRAVDEALLAEIVADRRLGKLGLRRLAPTVVIGDRPLPETLDGLRRAGYAPVEETPDGQVVLAAKLRHRAPGPFAGSPDGPTAARPARPAQPSTPAQDSTRAGDGADPAVQLVATLLGTADVPGNELIDLGVCVVDPRSLPELDPEVFVQDGLLL